MNLPQSVSRYTPGLCSRCVVLCSPCECASKWSITSKKPAKLLSHSRKKEGTENSTGILTDRKITFFTVEEDDVKFLMLSLELTQSMVAAM